MKRTLNNSVEFDRLNALLPRLSDGTLTLSETEELTRILEASTEAQARYLAYLQIHSELGSLMGSGSQTKSSFTDQLPQLFGQEVRTPTVTLRRDSSWGIPNYSSGLLACLLLIIGTLTLAVLMLLVRPALDVDQERAGHPMVSQAPSDGSSLSESSDGLAEGFSTRDRSLDPEPDAAVVVRTDGLAESSLAVGNRLKPGRIELSKGSVQMEFMSGVVLAFTGPGELRIHSKDSATLVSGSVSAHVPERARGFVLNSPSAAIVDLGTEFSVNVNPDGKSEVEVTSGSVELSLLGTDGNTLTSQRLHESTRMRVNGLDKSFTLIDSAGSAVSTITEPDDSGLLVSDQYVDAITEAGPVLYCRFESFQDSLFVNEISDRFAIRADPPESFSEGIRLGDGHVKFSRSEASRSLIMDESIEGFNEGPYTLEFWMKPDDLQHSTCLAVFPDLRTDPGDFLSVVEIVTDTFMIHEPGAIRFLHRSPPGNQFVQGTNAFTPGMSVPGQWQHVVAVKTDLAMVIYVNGQPACSVDLDKEKRNGEGGFHLILGQLRHDWERRQFSGALDELAIYRRALPHDEVKRHFALMRSANYPSSERTVTSLDLKSPFKHHRHLVRRSW